MQPFVESQKYRGALIYVISPKYKAIVTLERNNFTDIKIESRKDILSDEASLIYSDGASLTAINNTFELIGVFKGYKTENIKLKDKQLLLFD